MNKKKAAAFRLGLIILLGLAVLTAVEFAVSFLDAALIALFIIALFKAGLILEYFMHLSSLWSEEENH
jgi:heme/copper-type cytochrome/quinol oxidase subunit 4